MRTIWTGLVGAALLGMSSVSALGTALLPGDTQYANQASVSGTPKYTQGLPAYFVPANIVGQLSSPNVGALGGTTVSTVYKNPANNFLSFDYTVAASGNNTRVIVRGSLDGPWTNVQVFNTGSDASGTSGSGDPAPEWGNGDPNYIERDPSTQAPAIQWRSSDAIGTVIGPGDLSAHVWFETNSTEIRQSTIGYLDSGSVGSATILVPTTPIPEPLTLALFGSGALALLRRRRH